ncbi:MAG: acyl-CoA dehydrogenase family protein [Candidatus Yanofskybacteria bacterium]|nr:acyl-CoA dehydrogenase family protein [Candidatus Yanofskybacteria bacterium]
MPRPVAGGTFNELGKGVQIAEEQRDASVNKGFVASIFEGNPNFNLLFPWPPQDHEDARKEKDVIFNLQEFLKSKVEPDITRGKKDITPELIKDMAELGLFKLKVPEKYGGLGLSQTAYTHVIAILNTYCSSIGIMVSADNTIGAKFPVLNYGTPEQIEEYLSELMNCPSAFCFTEKEVGSDPARMRTHAIRVRNSHGDVVGYEIHGEKWYATNSVWRTGDPLAKYLAVVAKIVDSSEDLDDPKRGYCFGVFIVPNASFGLNRVAIRQRARFMGMPGIFNGILTFNSVYVGNRALIGGEGNGFKIALQALNAGRIAIAGSCAANSRKCLQIMTWWGKSRQQWGGLIGEKELIGSGMLIPAVVYSLVSQALTDYAANLTDRKKDCRLEAAISKVLASEWGWKIMDDAMQLRGGRGYESSESLAQREEAPPVDQMFVDSRPNRIFEGSTQILSQYVVREGLDSYLRRGKPLFGGGNTAEKISAVIWFAFRYLRLYFSSSLPKDLSRLPREAQSDLKFVEKHARKLARAIIICSGKYQAKMAHKQLTIDRLFWIAAELYAMAAVWSYVLDKLSKDLFNYITAPELAEMYCAMAKRRIKSNFASLWDNDDDHSRIMAKYLLSGRYDFIVEGTDVRK